MIRKLILALLLAIALVARPSVAADSVHNVVLVHGAFADGSSWAKVIPLLEKAGLNAVAVQNPLTSLADDVAATRRAIALQDGPVILVGHSWAGVVITEVGADPKVAALVYVSAFAPDVGEMVGDLGKDFAPPPGLAELRPDTEGYLTLTTKGVIEDFAPDLPLAQRKVVAATQGATNGAVFGTKVTNASWKTKPTWYIIAANDRMIQPDLERKFAKAMNAKTITLPSGHVAMLSHPSEVANLIIKAARTASAKLAISLVPGPTQPKSLALAIPRPDPAIEFDHALQDVMIQMGAGMCITPSADADRDFARAIIPHHQGAVEMAKVDLLYGNDTHLRR